MLPDLSRHFPAYTDYEPAVPVWCVTPNQGRVIHRFFDTSPFSPSGRYVALTRFPREDRYPRPGDVAEIVLVDLETGEERAVAETMGWDTQLGAQVQWGADDTHLFFNDVDPKRWRPYGVRLDPASGGRNNLEGTVYMISPDGKWSASCCLSRIGATQAGYGVILPPGQAPVNRGASATDGVYITNTESGQSKLVISWKEMVERARSSFGRVGYLGGTFYGFHIKWNPQGDRLMVVLRWIRGIGRFRQCKRHVMTLKTDGSDLHMAISARQWTRGGHHPNWCPDGETIIMNLNLPDQGVRFIRVRYDGSGLTVLGAPAVGSGHPTLHPNGKFVLTDAYNREAPAFGDGTTPIRLIDVATGFEQTLVRIDTSPPLVDSMGKLRVDPHPAWDSGFRYIAFNACPGGTRRVYVADLGNVVAAGIQPSHTVEV